MGGAECNGIQESPPDPRESCTIESEAAGNTVCRERSPKKDSKWKPKKPEEWAACIEAVNRMGHETHATLQAFVADLVVARTRKGQPNQLAVFEGKIGGVKQVLRVLVDSGASGNFMSMELARKLNLPIRPLTSEEADHVSLADGSRYELTHALSSTTLQLGSKTGNWKGTCSGASTLLLLPGLTAYDVILGTPFMSDWNANVFFGGNEPIVELDQPGPLKHRVSLTSRTKTAPSTTLASLKSWRRVCESGEVEQLFLCVVKPDGAGYLWDMSEEEEVLDSTPPPVNDGENEEEFNRLREEIEKEFGGSVIVDDLPPGISDLRGPGADHQIPLTEEGKQKPPPHGRPRRMSPADNDELKRVLADLTERGFIQPSISPYGSPVLFARKKDGTKRFCVDYRALNAISIKDKYPLPRIDELLDRLGGARYFSSLDLVSGYWQVRVAPEDTKKTAFQTRYGAFEFLVMPFGLSNAPSTFQRMMNQVFGPTMDASVLVYLDDILIFSKTLEEHVAHVKAALKKLQEHKLYAKRKKCVFFKTKLPFLGHIVSGDGVQVDPAKVEAITALTQPQNVSELRCFLGCVNFYRRFVEKFAHKAAPLTDLLRGNAAFIWTKAHQLAFEALKEALSTAPVLQAPCMDRPFYLYTDASAYALGAALMQPPGTAAAATGNRKMLLPVAYASKVLSQTERNWATHEREMLAVIYGLKQFRHYLLGSGFPVTVRTDHKSLTHFPKQKELTPKQVRWMEFLQDFDIKIEYVEGKMNWVADMLSRLRRGPLQLPNGISLNVISTVSTELSDNHLDALRKHGDEDAFAQEVRSSLGRGEESAFFEDDGLIFRKSVTNKPQLYVSTRDLRDKLLHEFHDSLVAGHLGRDKTLQAVTENYWWPSVAKDVEEYVRSCPACQLHKSRNQKPAGLLQPLPVPDYPWQQLTLDIMGPLPKTKNGFDAVVVFVDRLSKMVHPVPCTMEHGARDIARLFFRNVFRLHGLPAIIISDRDTRWTSHFWEALFSMLGTKLHLSTAFHPQTDGQSENALKTVQQVVRILTDEYKMEWDECLPAAEFAMNNATSASTQLSPFEVCYGRRPRVPATLLTSEHTTSSEVPAVHEWLERQADVIRLVQQNLEQAQARQKLNADRHRKAVSYERDQLVKVSTKVLRLKEHSAALSRKLTPRFCGPFKVVRVVGSNAVELDLPGVHARKHRTFNVSYVAPWNESERFPRDERSPGPSPEPLQLEGEDTYVVERFVEREQRKCGRHKRWEVLVKWKGYPDEDNTWEPEWRLRRDLGQNFKTFLEDMDSSQDEEQE